MNKYRCCIGLGDTLIYMQILLKYPNIDIYLNRALLVFKDNNNSYLKVLLELYKIINYQPKMLVNENLKDIPTLEYLKKINDYNLKDYFQPIFNNIKLNIDTNNYIVINTKMRTTNNVNLNFVELNNIFKKKINKTIILLGEKNIIKTNEGPTVKYINIYNECLKTLVLNNDVIDLTTDNFIDSYPDLNMFYRDLKIISNADFTITFGLGGQFVMNWFFAKKQLIFCPELLKIHLIDFINKKFEDKIFSYNYKDFMLNYSNNL